MCGSDLIILYPARTYLLLGWCPKPFVSYYLLAWRNARPLCIELPKIVSQSHAHIHTHVCIVSISLVSTPFIYYRIYGHHNAACASSIIQTCCGCRRRRRRRRRHWYLRALYIWGNAERVGWRNSNKCLQTKASYTSTREREWVRRRLLRACSKRGQFVKYPQMWFGSDPGRQSDHTARRTFGWLQFRVVQFRRPAAAGALAVQVNWMRMVYVDWFLNTLLPINNQRRAYNRFWGGSDGK